MKFAKTFQQDLLRDGYPEAWVQKAVSYKSLKKTIAQVEAELASIGLDAATLSLMLRSAEKSDSESERSVNPDTDDKQPFAYELAERTPEIQADGQRKTSVATFRPKLLFTIDEKTGEPVHTHLSPETKIQLERIAAEKSLAEFDLDDSSPKPPGTTEGTNERRTSTLHTIEVPLKSDNFFFDTLQEQLSGLADLQKEEEEKLTGQAIQVGVKIRDMIKHQDKKSKQDLMQWRRIFELYLDNRIFFSTSEQDPWAHSYEKASAGMAAFSAQLQKEHLTTGFAHKDGEQALQQFLNINNELLQGLHFQELNNKATMKIIKKFDKRTQLGATAHLTPLFESTPLPSSLARAVCAQISEYVLHQVPQVADYLCPVCYTICWRPVKLRCEHIFCIRCLVVMQRNEQQFCPLCRDKSVMLADSDSIDEKMAKHLKKYFPDEVKAKQKDNERAAGVDAYGELYNDTKCAVM